MTKGLGVEKSRHIAGQVGVIVIDHQDVETSGHTAGQIGHLLITCITSVRVCLPPVIEANIGHQRVYAAQYAASPARVYHDAGTELLGHVWAVWDQQPWRPVLPLYVLAAS